MARDNWKPPVPLSTEGKRKIIKIEAAVFQLETAIELWVSDADAVSTITLVYSAHEILRQLDKAKPSPRRSLAEIRPEQVADVPVKQQILKDWERMFKMDYNFCKHGGSDPNEVHYLPISNIPFVMMDAIHMYAGLGFKMRSIFHVFSCWLFAANPEVFAVQLQDVGFGPRWREEARRIGKQEFFKAAFQNFTLDMSPKGSPVVHAPPTTSA